MYSIQYDLIHVLYSLCEGTNSRKKHPGLPPTLDRRHMGAVSCITLLTNNGDAKKKLPKDGEIQVCLAVLTSTD